MIDKDAYRRDVLDPARAGGEPPADLLARYALHREAPPRADALPAHLEEIEEYWRTLRRRYPSYGKLVDALLAAHAELAGRGALTWAGLRAETDRRAEEAAARLAGAVAALAGSRVSRAALDHLVAETGGARSEAEVRAMLAEHGIGVVERPWELPGEPPSPAHRAMRDTLTLLGVRLSAEVVVGTDAVRRGFRLRDGFRLSTGERLTEELIAGTLTEAAKRPMDARKAPAESVLTTLREAAREPGRLDAVLLWEVMEILRPQVAAGLPAKLISDRAAELGLVREEAEELALAMLVGEPRPADAGGRVRQALEEGRLRAAERLLPGLTEDDPLRDRVEERARQVTEWTGEATRELAAGRTESAAELLDRACRHAADDDALADRLRALPPPPPTNVRAGAQDAARSGGTQGRDGGEGAWSGGRGGGARGGGGGEGVWGGGGPVTVAWRPSAARVGPVRYRVVRTGGAAASGAGDSVEIGETDANELVDREPPPGQELYYTVFAGRAEGIWSAPATALPLTLLPEIAEPVVTAGEREVTATWRLPPGAADAVVTRLDPHPGRLPCAGGRGFADAGVRPGQTYRYRVRVAYEQLDGTRDLSRGVVLTARPESAPKAVRDLTVERDGELDGRPPAVRISWPAPAAGRVVIRVADVPPPWPAGTMLAQGEAERYGRELPGAPAESPGGRMTLRAPLSGTYYTAVSVGAGRAVIGPSARLVVVEPVRDLTARRLGDTAVLSWRWPSGAQLAEVTWTPADDPGAAPAGTVECPRRVYEDDGCRITIGPGTVVAAVRTVSGETRSAPATVTVPGTGPEIRYEFRRVPLSRRAAVLVLTAARRCHVPPLVVVRRAGTVIPLRPDQGEVIHRVPAHELSPDSPHTVRVEVPRAAGPSRLACFPAGDAAGTVTLIPLPGTW